MSILVIDTENSGANRDKAAPFNLDNKCCYIGILKNGQQENLYSIEYDDEPYGNTLKKIQEDLDKAELVIFFNAKYDIHFLRRYGLRIKGKVFDVQLAWFILTAQKNPYPSLNQVAEYYGIETKLDVVKEEYWLKELDTDDVPREILEEYLAQDLKVTYLCYLKVMEDIKKQSYEMQRLISVSMQDLLVLEEMEWNGMLIDKEKSIKKGDEIVEKIKSIDKRLRGWAGCEWFNPNSGDHLSVFLYGGMLKIPVREAYTFVYKDGREVQKERNTISEVFIDRKVEPPKGSSLKKEGFFSTDVSTLIEVRERAPSIIKKVIDLLLSRSRLEKQRSTYYHGLPKKLTLWNWKDDIIHSTLNQCTTITGRLSSSKPNIQNLEKEVSEIFITRFN